MNYYFHHFTYINEALINDFGFPLEGDQLLTLDEINKYAKKYYIKYIDVDTAKSSGLLILFGSVDKIIVLL